MKYGLWELTNKESRLAAVEHTIFIPRVSGYRQRLALSGLRVKQPVFDLTPQDASMWSFLTPPQWDSSTIHIGCRFGELARIKDSRFSHRPWALPRFFDLPQTDSLVNFKGPFDTPTYKNIRVGLLAKPKVANPVPSFLEEVRAIRIEDKEYTDFLLRFMRDTIIEDLTNRLRDWINSLLDFEPGLKKWGELFKQILSVYRQVLSVLRQWLIFWLEGIYFD